MDSLFLALAAARAEPFIGATSPNPPVGAVLVKDGRILGAGAHKRAGGDHAEVAALKDAIERHGSTAARGATMYATLEPCNHRGRTPPCTLALLEAGVTRVVFGAIDPDPRVAGGGAQALRDAGLDVSLLVGHERSLRLIDGFSTFVRTGRPWVVLKQALRRLPDGSLTMIPEPGSKTFTSPESLAVAHLERRRSDAIITGRGTVLADLPRFNVRRLQDHSGKSRLIVVLSRSGRALPTPWLELQAELGNTVLLARSPAEALDELGRRSALRALVEGGPQVIASFERERLFNERLTFVRQDDEDTIVRERIGEPCSRES